MISNNFANRVLEQVILEKYAVGNLDDFDI